MESKWVGKSLTVWGGVVLLLPVLASVFGIEIGGVEGIAAAGVSIIEGIAAIAGFVMVVLGRLRANDGKPVTLVPK